MSRTYEIEKELLWQTRHDTKIKRIIVTSVIVIAVAAFVFILNMTLTPVIRIDGHSMENTYQDGTLVVFYTNGIINRGDVVAIKYDEQIIVKRVIAVEGDIVDIDDEGSVSVNGIILDEPYVYEKAKGSCDIELPHKVPDNSYFVMGDHRSVSLDSRESKVGDIASEDVIGPLLFK